jgi:hypothetical protein
MSFSTSPNVDIDSVGFAKMMALGLPAIRGTWFFVDPLAGSNSNDGLTPYTAVADLQTAYGKCTTNVGDGIAVLSADATTSANTTSHQVKSLAWSKNSITVFGVCAPTTTFQRARIANKTVTSSPTASYCTFPSTSTIVRQDSGSFLTDGWIAGAKGKCACSGGTANSNDGVTFIVDTVTATTITATTAAFTIQTAAQSVTNVFHSYIPNLVDISGSNNSFYNLLMVHEGTDILELNALKVSGNRNYFQNVHAGVGVADANTTITYSLLLSACQENTLRGCTFGLDTVDRGGVATYDILLSGAVARNKFFDCETIRQSTTGTGCLAVYASTTTGGRPTLFKNCVFSVWNTAGGNANCAYMGGSTGNCDFVWLVDCTYPGYAALSNDAVFWISGEVNSQAAGLMYT